MKKIILLAAVFTASMAGFAQGVHNFEVGPYEVDYKSPDDYKSRLRKDVDLYEYFGLKKDTVIYEVKTETKPVTGAWQANVSLGMPRYVANTGTKVLNIAAEGGWKQKIGDMVYVNGGLSASMTLCDDFTMAQFGIPVTIEYANVDYKKASLYGAVGVVPTFYTGLKDLNGDSKSGFYIVPKFELGAYVPTCGQLIQIGGYICYPEVNCSGGDDVIKERLGRFTFGAKIGLIF